ncbi:MAG: tRNA lysidine(34) synthetase TilS [Clostridia bacterium]|nr:tRNA lysidine(34) synthetase TilS [Clostridia bacterium]
MENKIEKAIKQYEMNDIFDGAIIGFSGGADSSAILHYLSKKTKKLLAVHINHMIRGEEALRDEFFCKNMCKKYGVKFLSFRVDIPLLAEERKQGLEETAREERYRIFNKIISQNGDYKCIVTAHNANDNAETVIFNLSRGSGSRGIAGIKPVINNIVRPLIFCSKEEILEYCKQNSISYVNDSTNMDTDYTRNYIRHEIIPMLEKINPSFIDSCLRMGELLRDDDKYIQSVCDKIIEENRIKTRINTELLVSQERPVASRLLMYLSKEALDRKAIDACLRLAKHGKVGQYVNLPNKLSFKKERGYVKFVETENLAKAKYNMALKEGLNYIEQAKTAISLNSDLIPDTSKYELVDAVKLKSEGKLTVRNKKDGDKMIQGKMTKKLKTIFCDKHIPSHHRDKIPLICDEKGILYIPTIAVRDGAKSKNAETVIKIFKIIENTNA